MSDSNKPGSILADLFSLAEEAGDFVEQIRVPSGKTDARVLTPEPLDWSIIAQLRKLLIHLAPESVGFTQEIDCFRVTIGTGIRMRVYEGSNVGETIIHACRGEGVEAPVVNTEVDGGSGE